MKTVLKVKSLLVQKKPLLHNFIFTSSDRKLQELLNMLCFWHSAGNVSKAELISVLRHFQGKRCAHLGLFPILDHVLPCADPALWRPVTRPCPNAVQTLQLVWRCLTAGPAWECLCHPHCRWRWQRRMAFECLWAQLRFWDGRSSILISYYTVIQNVSKELKCLVLNLDHISSC